MRMRVARFSGIIVAAVVALGSTRTAGAQQTVKLGAGDTLTISGFINATLFTNNGFFSFGNGQNAEYANAAQPATDKRYMDGDVRNTRLNFTFAAAPVLGKWSPRATIEADFFGAFGGTGAPPFGDEQPQLRVRFAYVDLTNGRTTVRIGQFWSPLFGEVPVSVTHLAFPLGYGATGMIGWRFPGIFVYHDLNPGKPTTVQLVLSAQKNGGPEVPAAGSGISTGVASAMPQLEGRLNFAHRTTNFSWSGYVVGHVDWKDTTAVGVAGNNLTGSGVEVGGNVTSGKFTIHGNVYTGKAMGQQFAHISQQGNVKGWGAWVQGGYDVTPHWGAWLFYGADRPDTANSPGLAGNFRSKNDDIAGMLRFRAGRYQLGLELFQASTTWATTGKQKATQIALSAMYTI